MNTDGQTTKPDHPDNPFAMPAPEWWPDSEEPWIYATTVDDQLKVVAEADAEKLRRIIAHPWAGTTVRKRAAARLRKFQKATSGTPALARGGARQTADRRNPSVTQ